MSQKITSKETLANNELLKIEDVQFRYTKEELNSENSWGFTIGNNRSFDEKEYKGIKQMKDSESYRNKDYYIVELEELLKNPTTENNLKIQKTLESADVLTAIYIPNNDFRKKNPYSLQFPSRIAHLLKKYNWLPNQRKEQERKKIKRKEAAAKILGFTMEEVELFTKYKEIKKLDSKRS